LQELIDKHLAALERAPASEKPFQELENLLTGASRWNELAGLYEKRALRFPDSPNAPRLLARAGDLLRTQMNDPARAEELYRRALVSSQNEPAALEGLKVIYRSKGDLLALADVLERRAMRAAPSDAGEIWLELGRVQEQLGRRDRAVLSYQRAARTHPKPQEAFSHAFDCLIALGRWRLAVDTLDSARARCGPEGLVPKYLSVAEKLLDLPPEHALAAKAVEAALGLAPHEPKARALREALSRYKETWRERVRALRLEADTEHERKRKASLLLSVALIYATFDPDSGGRRKAREALNGALLLWQGMPPALDALEQMTLQTSDWKGLAAFLEKIVAETRERGGAVEVLQRLAMIQMVRLGDRQAALAHLLKAAQLDPNRADVVGLAFDLLLDEGRPQEAAALLEHHLLTLNDRRAQVALRLRLAELLESRMSDQAGARIHLEAALKVDPGCVEAARRLAPLYQAAGEGEKLVAALELAISAEPDPAKRSPALERVAELYGERLGRPVDAVRALSRALVLQPGRPELGRALEKYAAPAAAWEEVALAYRIAADVAPPEVARALLRRSAELLESPLGKLEESLRIWERLLELDPSDAQALQAVGSLAARTGARQQKREPEERLPESSDPKQRRADLERRARSLEESGGDPAATADLYRKMLEMDPDDREALKRLGAACASLGHWDEVAEIAGRLAAVDPRPEKQREWRARRAQVLSERLGRPGEAAEVYLQLLREEPSRPGLLEALDRLAQEPSCQAMLASGFMEISEKLEEKALALELLLRSAQLAQAVGDRERSAKAMAAARSLERLIQTHDEKRPQADVLQTKAGQLGKDERMGEFMEIAQPRESQGQRPAAFAAALRSFKGEPQNKKLREELERVAAETGAFAELAAAYQEELPRIKDEALQLELWRRLGSIYGDRLGQPDRSAQAWEEVSRRAPSDAAVLETLARTYRRAARFRELVGVIGRQVALAKDPGRKRELLVEIAQLCEEKLSDQQSAVTAWSEIRKIREDDAQAQAALSRLLSEVGRFKELAELTTLRIAQAERQGKHEEALELRVQLGRIKLTRLCDPRGALTLFTEILSKRPGHPSAVAALQEMAQTEGSMKAEAARALEPVFAQNGEFLKLVQVLDARSQGAPPQERSALLRRIAETYAGPLASLDMAFVYAARALEAAPDDLEALAAALKLGRAAGVSEDLAELLGQVVEKAHGDEARAAIQRALARLLAGELSRPPQAIAAYRRLLEIAPGDPEALDELAKLLREAGQWGDLLEVLRRQLATAQTQEKRVELFFGIAAVQDEKLNDPSSAISTLRRLLEVVPDDLSALERLDKLCERAERWAELADTIAREEALSEKAGRKEAQIALKFRLAQVREQRLLDRAGALALYRELLAAQAGHPKTVARLEAMVAREPGFEEAANLLADNYRSTGNHAKLAKLLDDRSQAASDPVARKRYLNELAVIRAKHQEQPEAAFLALCKAFREDPADAELRASLEKAAEQSGMLEALAGLYEEELHRLQGRDAAEVSLKLAQVSEQNLKEPEQALAYYERARQQDPLVAASALAALDRLYKERGEWAELSEVLTARVALAEEPADRAALLFRLGQIAEEKLDPPSPDRATRAYEQILEADPGHLPSARALERLYEAARRYDRLFSVLDLERAKAAGPDKERLTARMAEVAASGLQDPARAVELYKEVLALNSRSERAFLALEELYEQAGQAEDLIAVIKQRLAITVDPREITRLSEKMGRALASLGRNEEAIAAFKATLDRDPRHRKALESLCQLYEQAGPSDDLANVLRRLIPLQDDANAIKGVRLRLAEVLAALGRREEAVEAARRALDVEPHKPEELARAEELFRSLSATADLIRAMETRAELSRSAGDVPGAVAVLYSVCEVHANVLGRREAAAPIFERILDTSASERIAYDALREIYAAQSDWRRYAAACERFLPGVGSPLEKVEVLKELAAVQEQRLGQKDFAFLSCCRAFSEAPGDEELRQTMHRLAEETGSFEELATVYEELVDSVEKGPLAERLYLALATIQDERLDSPEEAEAALRKVLEFDPTNKSALEALSKMFSRRGQDNEYVVSLEQKLEAAGGIEERKVILREIAQIYETRLNQPDEAVTSYERALQLEPDRDTFRQLAELLRRQKKFREMAEVLVRARDFETEPQLRAKLQTEVAEVYEREIQDDEAAVAGFRLALEFDPENRDALAALELLYTKLDRPAELLSVYDAQVRLASDPRERVKILFKTASIWEDKYQNLGNADACLEAVLMEEPANLQAIKGLERIRLLDAEAKRPNLARWEDLLRVYEQHLTLQLDLTEQVELLVAMGEVYYKELKRTDRAAQIFHRALEIDPRSRTAMHALGLLYERSGNWPFALEMLAREAELSGTSKEAVELFHRIGKINEEMLLDTAAAKQSFLKALEIDRGYLPSLRALKGIYEAQKDWDAYLEVLIQEAQYTVDVEERAQAWLDVARYYQDSREDRDNASRYYEEALKLVPDSLEAARPLADIYVAREEWEKAEKMLDVVVAKLSESAARDPQMGIDLCRQLYRLGYVCEKMKKSERALGAYERAYQLDATYLPAAEGYANLLVGGGRFADALSVYQAILIHHREDLTDLEVVEYYWQVGELYRKLGQHERAQRELDKALAIDGNHEPSLRSQVELCESVGDYERAIEHRSKLVSLLEGEARFAMLVAVGNATQEKLKDPYRAIDAFLEASKLKDEALEVLEKLLGLYRETRQSQKAVEVLEKLLALPAVLGDPGRARRLYFSLGEIYRDESKDVGKAADAFNRALDVDFRFIQAFSALEELLGSNRQWDALEQNYLRMIQRLPKTDDTHAARMMLFRALAEYYEKVKKDKKATKQVYQVVMKGAPDDVKTLEKYAELCSEEEGNEKESIEAWRRALPSTENLAKGVSQLARLFAKMKDYDGAFVAAQVAASLVGEVGDDEREILAKLSPYAKRREQAQKPMTNSLWTTKLFHPKVRGPMGDILALVYDRLGAYYAKKPSTFGIDPRADAVDLGADFFAIASYRYVLQTLDMEAVGLYSPFLVFSRDRARQKGAGAAIAPDKDLFLELMHTHPVALKAGGKLFAEVAPKELYFYLAKTLTFTRPELVLSRVLPLERLDAVFQAAVMSGLPSFKPTADPRAVEAERRVMERLEPQFKPTLARLARDYAKSSASDDVREFVEGAELTANRAGALLCADLEVVKAALSRETGSAARVPLRSRIRDMMLFCLSPEHIELRRALGLKIEIKVAGGAGR
jgi:tetratricopeptide (TPR) repeat protein